MNELFVKRAVEAEVTDVHFHDLQRTFISNLRYDRRKMDTRRRAIAMLRVPYHRREKAA